MSDRRYCLNPSCQNPENAADADICESCGSPLLLGGHYHAIRPIGAGGMGRTFLATDESQAFKPQCVIKQFLPQNTSDRHRAAELFRQEAIRLEELGSHPQIPQLLGSFEEDGSQYLVQEYIEGRNLAEELAEEGAFDETKIRQLLQDLLPVLQFIHDRQVIHRDIKPENIIRSQKNNHLVLVDFGAAKFATQATLGKTGTIIGSAAYTAPEQVRGKAVFASDLYSLAVTCIHLMTMVPPFDLFDSNEAVWIWRHYLKTPLSRQLEQILDKMLRAATKERYQSALEVGNALHKKPNPFARIPVSKKWLAGGVAGTILVFSPLVLFGSVSFRRSAVPPAPVAIQPAPVRPPLPQTPPSELTFEYVPEEAPPPTAQSRDYGGLYVQSEEGEVESFTLQHTEVTAKITGNLSRVEVVQTFSNPYNTPLEAVYKFPLPDEAAVDDMEIRIGDRIIRGVIKKREEAKQIYQEAKQQGKTTALLEQERPNIFTQSLANIRPGETIEVVIRYTESLQFEAGDYEFVFPMTIGPRYVPGSDSETTVNPTAQAQAQATDSAVNSPMLPPEVRSARGIGVTVEIDAGVPIWDVRSPSHQLEVQKLDAPGRPGIAQLQLSPSDTIPNKDLILRYRVAGAQTQSTVLSQADNRGGHFATYFVPAIEYQSNQIVPKDVVFLMDTSGSQAGAPLEQSKALMRRFVNGLNPEDTFTIIDFANTSRMLSRKPLANTPKNRQKAMGYINGLRANGGTKLLNGFNSVLQFPAAENGRLRSIVLLTDGYISNENQIIARVQQGLQPGNRLYSFGVGSSPNRFLLDRLGEVGRGISYMVRHDEPIDEVTAKFFSQINNPVLTNIEVVWEGLGEAPEIYPQRSPDLFAEQPLVLFGRKQDRLSGNLRVTGIAAGGKRYEKTFYLDFEENKGNSAIAQLWGRAKIKELMTKMASFEAPDGIAAVTDIALAYRLMSKYTAFVAVSDDPRVNPNSPGQKQKVANFAPQGRGYYAGVPEPSFFWATLMFGLFLGWKRWTMLRKARV